MFNSVATDIENIYITSVPLCSCSHAPSEPWWWPGGTQRQRPSPSPAGPWPWRGAALEARGAPYLTAELMVAARDEAASELAAIFSCRDLVRLSILLMDSEDFLEAMPRPERPPVMRDSDCWRSSDGLGIWRTLVLVARMLCEDEHLGAEDTPPRDAAPDAGLEAELVLYEEPRSEDELLVMVVLEEDAGEPEEQTLFM